MLVARSALLLPPKAGRVGKPIPLDSALLHVEDMPEIDSMVQVILAVNVIKSCAMPNVDSCCSQEWEGTAHYRPTAWTVFFVKQHNCCVVRKSGCNKEDRVAHGGVEDNWGLCLDDLCTCRLIL